MPRSIARRRIAQNYDPRWSVWARRLWRIANHQRQYGARIEQHHQPPVRHRSGRGLSLLAEHRSPALRSPAAAPASVSTDGGSGRSDLFQAGAFMRHTAGAAYLAGALAYGWQDVTTDRTVTVAGIDRLRAQFNANAFSGRVEGGYRFVAPWIGGVGITPYAAGQFTTFELPGLCRTGRRPAPTPLRWPMARRASPPPAANSACAPTNPLP